MQDVEPQDVVCNASPLIFVAKIDRLDLLDNYSVRITTQVESETLKGLEKKRKIERRKSDNSKTENKESEKPYIFKR